MGGAKVDYAAHFGGALAGALVGLALWKTWDPGSPTPRGRGIARAITLVGMLGLAWGAYGVAQTRGVATALAPQDELRPVISGTATPEALDALVRRWPRDPRVRFIRAASRINAGNAAGAEDDLRAALAQDRVLRTGFRDRRLETEVRTLLAQVLAQRGQEAEARAVVAPVCHSGPGGRAPTGLAMLGLCEAR
jgi:rhomboid protease GluP